MLKSHSNLIFFNGDQAQGAQDNKQSQSLQRFLYLLEQGFHGVNLYYFSKF